MSVQNSKSSNPETNNNNNDISISSNPTNSQIVNSSSIEIDSQFILRMPVIKQENGTFKLHESTIVLRELLEKFQLQQQKFSSDNKEDSLADRDLVDPLKDRLFIELNTETRKGRVKFDNEIFEARLVDLPCIIESLKTTDRKMFYKTGDICQMLVCRTQDDPWSSNDEDQDQSKLNKLKKNSLNQYYDPTNPAYSHLRKYQWPHGITAPLKNVRRKRFRKVAKKKLVDYADIEKEVKQLFRADRDAHKIDYEVAYVDAESAEFLEDDEVNDIKSNDDYSSQDENTLNKSLSEQIKSKTKSTGSSEAKSSLKATQFKSKEIIDESNLSSAADNDIYDDSSLMNPSHLKSHTNYDDQENTTNTNNPSNNDYDDEDASNMSSSLAVNKESRTTFKNLFVKQVIGDLSSSEEDADNEDEKASNKDDDDEINDDNDGVEDNESKISKIKDHIGQNDEESESNLESAVVSKSKYSFNDKNDNNEFLMSAGDEMDDSASNLNNKTGSNKKEDIENLSLSSTSSSSTASSASNVSNNKQDLKQKLNKLMDELHRITEERKRREVEINPINNPVLKAHLSSRLNNLIEEENKKTNEINELKSLLNE